MSRRIYVAILQAAACGKGLHLTADEVFSLRMDDAIATAACNQLTPEEVAAVGGGGPNATNGKAWGKIKP